MAARLQGLPSPTFGGTFRAGVSLVSQLGQSVPDGPIGAVHTQGRLQFAGGEAFGSGPHQLQGNCRKLGQHMRVILIVYGRHWVLGLADILTIWKKVSRIVNIIAFLDLSGTPVMPQLIEHIDAIVRKVGRDVLFLVFFQYQNGAAVRERWDVNPSRKEVISWLDANGYAWREYGKIASDDWMTMGYRGSIYLDAPFEGGIPPTTNLSSTCRIRTARFGCRRCDSCC